MQIPGIVRTVIPVIRGVFPEWNVSDHKVELLRKFDIFERSDPDVGLRIERFRDASGNPIDLDCGERITVLTRRESDEIPGSRPQFGDFPEFDSQFSARNVPHEVDDGFGRVITVENGVLRRLILLIGKQLFERLIVAVVLDENLG